jgi:hypothetical protein
MSLSNVTTKVTRPAAVATCPSPLLTSEVASVGLPGSSAIRFAIRGPAVSVVSVKFR